MKMFFKPIYTRPFGMKMSYIRFLSRHTIDRVFVFILFFVVNHNMVARFEHTAQKIS